LQYCNQYFIILPNTILMARVQPITEQEISPVLRLAFEQHVREYNAVITNMKSTLAHSLLSFDIYMQWYPLYQKVKQVVGERTAYLFAYSISTASNCPLCSVFFRRIMIEAGENPDSLVLSEYETTLLNFGSAVAQYKGCISNQVYNDLARHHSTEEIVVLTAFAGQMIATNIFNNVIETEIDTYLTPYIPVKFSL
jgi:hypothetical protein